MQCVIPVDNSGFQKCYPFSYFLKFWELSTDIVLLSEYENARVLIGIPGVMIPYLFKVDYTPAI